MGKCKKRGIVILKYREETRCLLEIEGNLKSQRCNLIGCLYAISIDKGHRCFSVWQKKKKKLFLLCSADGRKLYRCGTNQSFIAATLSASEE